MVHVSPQNIELVLTRIGMLLSPGGYTSLQLLYDRVRTKHIHIHIHTAVALLWYRSKDNIYYTITDSFVVTVIGQTFSILRKDPFQQIVFIQHMVVSANTSFTLYLYSVKNSLGVVKQLEAHLSREVLIVYREIAITDT